MGIEKANAIIQIVGKKRENAKQVTIRDRADGSSGSSSTSTKVREKIRVQKAEPKTCTDENYVPLKLLNIISESDEGPISIEENLRTDQTPKTLKIIQRPYLKTCTSFRYELAQVEGKNTAVLSVINDFDFESVLLDKTININGKDTVFDQEKLKGMSTNDKYEACLIASGILKPNSSGAYELTFPEDDSHYAKSAESFEVAFDAQQSMKIVFGSPIFLGSRYGSDHGWVSNKGIGMDCLKLENVDDAGGYLYTEADVETAKYIDICERGNHVEIRQALKSLGNAPELRKIMEKALEKELINMAEENYKKLQELGSLIKKASDEDELRQYVDEYLDKLLEIKKYVLNPSIEKLQNLLKKRKRAKSDKEREKIDEQIYKLNQQIAYYAKNERKFLTSGLLDKLLENGFSEAAIDIAEFKLKSLHFGNVYAELGRKARKGRGQRISVEKANREIENSLRNYTKRAEEAERIYLAKQGEARFTPEIGSRIEKVIAARDRRWNNDITNIQENLQSCSPTQWGYMKSPARCNNAMRNQSTWLRQAYSRRGRYNQIISRDRQRYDMFSSYEAEGARRRVAELGDEGDNFGGGDFLGSYGANGFYPISSDLNQSPFYDPSSMVGGQPGYGPSVPSFQQPGYMGTMMNGPNPYGSPQQMGGPQYSNPGYMSNQQPMFMQDPYGPR